MVPDLKEYALRLQKELRANPTYSKAREIGLKINNAKFENRYLTIEEKREVVRHLKSIYIVKNEKVLCESSNDDFTTLVDIVMSIVNGGNN